MRQGDRFRWCAMRWPAAEVGGGGAVGMKEGGRSTGTSRMDFWCRVNELFYCEPKRRGCVHAECASRYHTTALHLGIFFFRSFGLHYLDTSELVFDRIRHRFPRDFLSFWGPTA